MEQINISRRTVCRNEAAILAEKLAKHFKKSMLGVSAVKKIFTVIDYL